MQEIRAALEALRAEVREVKDYVGSVSLNTDR
jgi:hypothetical protein